MTRYSVQPTDRIFVKGYGFLVKIKVKVWVVNIAKNFLIMLKNLQQMHLKLLQKVSFKKQQKQLVIWLAIKLLIELQKFQKIHNKIFQRQLQMNMTKKHLKKNMKRR